MKMTTALKRLTKAGFSVTTNGTHYEAVKGEVSVTFNGQHTVSRFCFASSSSCAPTFGMTLTQCINAAG